MCVGAFSFQEVKILHVLTCVSKKLKMQNKIIKLFFKFIFILFCYRPGDDWKKTLKLPPKDLRIKTSVRMVEL